MAILKLTVDSITGGMAPLFHGAGKGQYGASLAIDPELDARDEESGYILPAGYSEVTGGSFSDAPLWMSTNDVNSNLYAYGNAGNFYAVNADYSVVTLIDTVASSTGNGMAVYNGFAYLATSADVARYSIGSGVMTASYWQGVVGFGSTGNPSRISVFPSPVNFLSPNHPMHVHSDGALYFGALSAGGAGIINKIYTDNAGNQDATVPSLQAALDLPIGVSVTDIETFGLSLAVCGFRNHGNSAGITGSEQSFLYLWDCVSDTFYQEIRLPFAVPTAMLNLNGSLYIFGATGHLNNSCYRYDGGSGVTQVFFSPSQKAPLAGAVVAIDNQLVWGTHTDVPNGAAAVMTLGFKDGDLGGGAYQCVGSPETGTASNQAVTALAPFTDSDENFTMRHIRPAAGWYGGSTSPDFGMSRPNRSATKNSVFRTRAFTVPGRFKVRSLRVPLTRAVNSTFQCAVRLVYDEETQDKQLTTINNANYPGATEVHYKAHEIEQAGTSGVTGRNDVFAEFVMDGTSQQGLALPIELEIETLDD